MSRRALRREAVRRLDTRATDVAAAFGRLTSAQKADLICQVPELYFAVARMVRMREIATKVAHPLNDVAEEFGVDLSDEEN